MGSIHEGVDNFLEFIGIKSVQSELLDLKKSIANTAITDIFKKEKKTLDDDLKIKLVNYLVDDGSIIDKIHDLFLDFFSKDINNQLRSLRQKIKGINNKSDGNLLLNTLSSQGAHASATETSSISSNQGSNEHEISPYIATPEAYAEQMKPASIEEAINIGKYKGKYEKEKLRMNRLFPHGAPKTAEEAERYMTTINVDIINKNGTCEKKSLKIHKRLSNVYKAIFSDLKEAGIKIDAEHTGAFTFRNMRKSSQLSHHSFGSAIDINSADNGGVYGPTKFDGGLYNGCDTVKIFKKYGFDWGGDRSAKYKDPMHFSYTCR